MGAAASLSAQQKKELQGYVDSGKGYVKTYSKEAYKVIRAGVKEGRRIAKNGVEVARAIARRVDLTNSRRDKAIAAALAERRAALLQNKKVLSNEIDDDIPDLDATASEPLIVIEGDTENDIEEESNQPIVGNIFEEDNVIRSQATDQSSARKRMESAEKQRQLEGQVLRIALANKISDEHLLVDINRHTKGPGAVKSKMRAVTLFKTGMENRMNEKMHDKFGGGAASAPQDNWGSDIAGWNVSHSRPFAWISVAIYIIRCPGDCQREVDKIQTDIMPALQQLMLNGAITLEVRDLGPENFQGTTDPVIAMKHAIEALLEPNAVRIVLLGNHYGDTLCNIDDFPILQEWSTVINTNEASLLDIFSTVAANTSSFNVTGTAQGNSWFRTLVYACVDPRTQSKSGLHTASNTSSPFPQGATPLRGSISENYERSTDDLPRRKISRNALGSLSTLQSMSSPNRSATAEILSLKKSSVGSSRKNNPLAMVKRKQAEALRLQKEKLMQVSAVVFKGLCQDPHTGKARPPYQIFMDLDEDGGGTVDKEEFVNGIQICGITLDEEDINLLWSNLDSEGTNELDFETLGAKLQEQYEKVLQQELKNAERMPFKLSLKLEKFLPREVFTARLDTMKDFMDTSDKQSDRWLKEFKIKALDDLQRLIPLVAVSVSSSHHNAQAHAVDHAEPLCFCPEVPEFVGHSHIISEVSASNFQDSDATFRLEALKTEILNLAKENTTWPTVLIGGKGSGKTSVLSRFINDLRKARPFDHVIFICVAQTPDSSELALVLLQICMEVGKRFNVLSEVLTYDIESVEKFFPKLLMKLVIETVLVIVIDGLDMLVKDGQPLQELHWFPDTVPAGVRFVFSCDDSQHLELLKKLRSKYSGPTEINEVRIPEIQSGTGSGRSTPSISRASSALSSNQSTDKRSTTTSHEGDFNTKDENNLMFRSLVSSPVFIRAAAQMERSMVAKASVRTDVRSMVSAILDQVCEMHGPVAVRRYLLLTSISRCGILEQDLYELLNANSNSLPQLPFSRVSWQEFCTMKKNLQDLVHRVAFGSAFLLDVKHNSLRKIFVEFFGGANSNQVSIVYHRLLALHYYQRVSFLHSLAVWHGEYYRAVTEVAYHLSHAFMWNELMEIMTSLRYIEARCSLGKPQAFSLLCDYQIICSNKDAEAFWIKTDLLKIKDCHAMVKRFSGIFSRHPIWTFSVAASLPDTTSPSRLAKLNWTSRNETRPQLVWLNKPAGQSPCQIKISEPKIVMHCGCFSQDMTKLVLVGQDKTVFVWAVHDGALLCELHGHLDQVTSCDVSADDKYILTCSADGKLLLWRMPQVSEQNDDGNSSEDEEIPKTSEAKIPRKVMQGSPIKAISAHNNTAWTCAFSTIFVSAAEICLISGAEERASADFLYSGQFAKHGEGRPPKSQVPITLRGIVRWTRKVTDEEKRKIKLNQIAPKPYDATAAKEALRNVNHGRSAKFFSKSTLIDDYECQDQISGKIAVFSLSSVMVSDVIWKIAQDIFRAGACAIIFVNESDEAAIPLSRTASEVDFPVLSVGKAVGSSLKNDQCIEVRRKLAGGSMMASGSSDCSVKIWDVREAVMGSNRTIQPKAILKYHQAYISHVSFSNYGLRLASSSGDFKVVVWDLTDFSPVKVYSECLAPAMCSVWSPDDSIIGTACHDGYFRIWNVDDCKTLKASQGPHTGHLWACSFANNDKFFTTAGHEGTVVLWDLNQMLLHNKEVMVFQGHSAPVFSCRFSKDSSKIVTASADRSVRVWRTDRDLEDYSLSYIANLIEKRNEDLKSKQNLKDILSNANKGWTYAGAAKVFWEAKAHKASVTYVCFSPDSLELLTAGADFNIIVWSVKTDLSQPTIIRSLRGHGASITALCYAPDGKQIASGCSGGVIVVWDSKTGRRIREFRDHTDKIWALDIDPSGKRLISSSADCTVRLWRLDDPLKLKKATPGLTIYSDSDDEDSGQAVKDISENGNKKKTVNVMDETVSPILQEIQTPRIAYSCCFAPNGLWMATGSADSLIQLYRFVDASMLVLELFKTVPPDGSESADKHRSYIRKILFDYNSRRILSCGVDGTLKLWSTRNGLRLRTYNGHEKEVWTCHITSDATAVVSCSLDGTARIWNLESGEQLFHVKHDETIFACGFSPDSRFMVTGSYDGIVRLWEKDRMDFQKKQSRGWPRVRDLVSKIARMKDVPSALSLDGRTCCYVKADSEMLGEVAHSKKALKQTITVEHTVTGNIEYAFVLNNPADIAAMGGDNFDTIIFVSATTLRSYVLGTLIRQENSGHKAAILDIRFAEDGKAFATASADSFVIVWKIEEGVMTRLKRLKGHTSSVMSICFSPNGQLLASGSQDFCFKLWNTSTWNLVCTVAQAHSNYVTCCAFDALGQKMLSGGEDRCIRIWTIPSRLTRNSCPRESVRIRHLRSSVICADFTEDGTRVVALLSKHQVHVWHATKGTALCSWDFTPFDTEKFMSSQWRNGTLSLTSGLNAAVVTDSAGNTITFALLGICSSVQESEDG